MVSDFTQRFKTPFCVCLFCFCLKDGLGAVCCQQVDDSVQMVGSFMDSCLWGACAHSGLLMGTFRQERARLRASPA